MKTDNTRIAVYTGSFDPITLGHLNVIQRSSRLVDQLVVGVGVNVEKTSLFTPQERLPHTILGFPTWAFYAVVASVLYACFIAYCLQRHWDLSASGEEDDDEEEHGNESSVR